MTAGLCDYSRLMTFGERKQFYSAEAAVMSVDVVLDLTAPVVVVVAVEGRVSVPLILAFASPYFFVLDTAFLVAASVSTVVAAAVVRVSVQIEVVPLASAQLLTKKEQNLREISTISYWNLVNLAMYMCLPPLVSLSKPSMKSFILKSRYIIYIFGTRKSPICNSVTALATAQ